MAEQGLKRIVGFEDGKATGVTFRVGQMVVRVDERGVYVRMLPYRSQRVDVELDIRCECCGEMNEMAFAFNGKEAMLTKTSDHVDPTPRPEPIPDLDLLRDLHLRGEG